MCVCLLSHVLFFASTWAVARKTPLSVEFSRQEYWRGLPFASPGDLPHSGIKPGSIALQADFYPLRLTVKFSHFHPSLWLDLFIKLRHWVMRLSNISSNIGFILNWFFTSLVPSILTQSQSVQAPKSLFSVISMQNEISLIVFSISYNKK